MSRLAGAGCVLMHQALVRFDSVALNCRRIIQEGFQEGVRLGQNTVLMRLVI